jgi:hypothetical protein
MRTRSSPNSSRSARSATWAMPSGFQAPLPTSSFVVGTPKSTTLRTPTRTNARTSSRSEATVCWKCPGNDVIARGSKIPSATKSGATRSCGASVVSATSWRIAGVRRSRRGRSVGNTSLAYCDQESHSSRDLLDVRESLAQVRAPSLDHSFVFARDDGTRRRAGHHDPRVCIDELSRDGPRRRRAHKDHVRVS